MAQGKKYPSLQEHVRVFEEWYRNGGGIKPNNHHDLVLKYLPQIRDHKVESFLDIGCGRGRILEEFLNLGFTGCGTEIVDSLLEKDLKSYKVFPCSAMLLDTIGESQKFDLIILCDVLPYLRNKDEIDFCLTWCAKNAASGVIVTVGEEEDIASINEDKSWWKEKIEGYFGDYSIDVKSRKGISVVLYGLWR